MLRLFLSLSLAALAQSESILDAWRGFVFGMQRDPTNPTDCIKTFNALPSFWFTFTTSLQTLDIIEATIELTEYTNQLNIGVNECRLNELYQKVSSTFVDEVSVGLIFVKVSQDFNQYQMKYNQALEDWRNGLYFNSGTLFGNLFSDIFEANFQVQMEQTKEYVKKLSTHFENISLMQIFTSATGLECGYLVIGIVVVLFLLVISEISESAICDCVSIVYPAYMSFKAIESKQPEDDKQWLTYWTVFALYKIIDFTASSLFFWIPYYYSLKFIVIIWLIYPEARGATIIYDAFLKRYMDLYSEYILNMAETLKGQVDQASSNIKDSTGKSSPKPSQ